MADIRMYIQRGCPHCEAAKQYLISRNVTVEVIEVGFDPILQAGIRASSGNGQLLPVPIIISFVTQEVAVGNDVATLERLASAVPSYRPIAPDVAHA